MNKTKTSYDLVDGNIVETMTTPITRGSETKDHVTTRVLSITEARGILQQRDNVIEKLTDQEQKKEATAVRNQLAELLPA